MSTTPPPPPPPTHYTLTYTPITIILSVTLLLVFFVGFFSIYFCRCFMHNLLHSWHLRQHSPGDNPPTTTPAVPNLGLDDMIVKSFPTFPYSTVKDYRIERYGLECAICLIEFEDTDVLRLLTTCRHVFHEECIDLWLESQKTCPVCRRNLELPGVQSSSSYTNYIMHSINENEPVEDSFSITITEENEEEIRACSSVDQQQPHQVDQVEKFSRSNSTGHSIVRNRVQQLEDRFTLRLPEHVRSQIINGHNPSKSWSTFGDYKQKAKNRNTVLSEISGLARGDTNEV